MEITPENITELALNEIFVFGSNLRGVHGAGAAKLAHTQFGARYEVGIGPTGNCYALPTKDYNVYTLPLNDIQDFIEDLEVFIIAHPDKKFLITKIGCGLAGYIPEQIAPMFKKISKLPNITLPRDFWEILEPLELLAQDCLQSCIKNEWKRDWSNGGIYLYLQVSEFIEALRGKGNPLNEAADVLFCFLALIQNHDLKITDVISKLQKLNKDLS